MRRNLSIFVLVAGAAFAQAPAKLVTLDIVAFGVHGQAIRDLRRDEIEIFDDKKPQSIVYWRSNKGRPDTPRVTVVVVSLENIAIKSAAWNEAIGAMRRFEASEYVYFYVVTNSGVLLPVHGIPKPDADSPPANLPWMAELLPQFELYGNRYQLPPAEGKVNYSSNKGGLFNYSQYAEIATRLATFPGTKNLICIGCLLSNSTYWVKNAKNANAAQAALAADLRQLGDAFRQSRVAVYVVGGLEKPKYLASEVSQVSKNVDLTFLNEIDAFAGITGGRAYTHGEIEQVVTQAASDRQSDYWVAYLPPAENWDGKPHRLRVVSTRNGVRLLAPAWYVADPLEDVVREWKPSIPDSVITSPFDRSDIDVSVSAPERVANTVRIQIRVSAADLLLFPRNGRYTGNLALQALCYTPDGRRLACTEPLLVNLDLSGQQRETAMRGGLRFPLSLPSGEVSSKIRVVAYDANSGASGSSTFLVQETH